MAIVAHADATAAVTIATERSAEMDGVIATTLAVALFIAVVMTVMRFAVKSSAKKDGIIATTLALATWYFSLEYAVPDSSNNHKMS